MRIVFMGTPQLSATILEKLFESHDVAAVYTRPDAVRGRGKSLVASPVKQTAEQHGVQAFTPSTLCDDAVVEKLREIDPDVICVAAYGAILPSAVLDIPRYGCINVHTSLLPRWRGAAPMQRAILAGDDETGVCIMRMEKGLDTGAYCKRVVVPVEGKYLSDIAEELAFAGASALVDALSNLENGKVTWIEQAQDGITYASKISKGELWLNPLDSADVTCAKIRASDAAHPARASFAGRSLTVERARPVTDDQSKELCTDLSPGDLVLRGKRLLAACADGSIEVERVKPDGKKSMEARAFAGGIQGIKGTVLQWGSC